MRSGEDSVDFESDETPLSSSQRTIKIQGLHCEVPHNHILLTRAFSSSRFLRMMRRNTALRSIYIILIKAKINVLLPFGPLAILMHYVTGKHAWVFFFQLIGHCTIS